MVNVNEPKARWAKLFSRYTPDKQKRFRLWIKDNPQVFRLFKQLAIEYKDSGRDKCSAALIGNVLRWHTNMNWGDTEFKIKNDWLPMMARLLVFVDPAYDGFFDFRDGVPDDAATD